VVPPTLRRSCTGWTASSATSSPTSERRCCTPSPSRRSTT
jgi:hypothetical protein